MLRRFNLGRLSFGVLGVVVAMGLAGQQAANALTISPANLERSAERSPAVSPVHCQKHRHYHKRCRACQRVYHTCPDTGELAAPIFSTDF